ncbi:MAG: PssD/Cps14F family polysaccharide biosynthesis glycosyltransferase, partial [Culicoidibacterales bacterium]
LLLTEKTETTANLTLACPVKYLVYGTYYQNKLIYLIKLGWNTWLSLWYFLQFRPDVIVTTGSHTAVPMCYLAKVFGKKIIYLESIAKVSGQSWAGKLVYPKADHFFVQWPENQKDYPGSIYAGQLLGEESV